jgi:hypothetical protein
LANSLVRDVIERMVSLEIFYMENGISFPIVTANWRNFDIVGKGRFHYLVCIRWICFLQRLPFFFNRNEHLLALLLPILHITLSFLVLDVCWPVVIRLIRRRLTMAVMGIIELAVVFTIGWQLLGFFMMWLLGGNVPPALGVCSVAFES